MHGRPYKHYMTYVHYILYMHSIHCAHNNALPYNTFHVCIHYKRECMALHCGTARYLTLHTFTRHDTTPHDMARHDMTWHDTRRHAFAFAFIFASTFTFTFTFTLHRICLCRRVAWGNRHGWMEAMECKTPDEQENSLGYCCVQILAVTHRRIHAREDVLIICNDPRINWKFTSYRWHVACQHQHQHQLCLNAKRHDITCTHTRYFTLHCNMLRHMTWHLPLH